MVSVQSALHVKINVPLWTTLHSAGCRPETCFGPTKQQQGWSDAAPLLASLLLSPSQLASLQGTPHTPAPEGG